MRRNEQPRLFAIALASTVLPVPGTSSIRTWPRHSSATRAKRTSLCLPTMTRSTLARTRSPVFWMVDIWLPSTSSTGWYAGPARSVPVRPRRSSSAATKRGRGGPHGHQRAGQAHDAQEQLVAAQRGNPDGAEHEGHDQGDGGEP